jgi:hypothetical protein
MYRGDRTMGLRFLVRPLAGDETLGGSENGARLLANMIPRIAASKQSSGPVFLDFDGIRIATASFLRECVLGLRSYCQHNRPGLHVVVANAHPVVVEELHFLLTRLRDALPSCRLDARGAVSEARILGVLDEKQAVTLQAIVELGGADARTLTQKVAKERIGITGWNNRLAALAGKGLVMETRSGRAKIYRPILEGLSHGP